METALFVLSTSHDINNAVILGKGKGEERIRNQPEETRPSLSETKIRAKKYKNEVKTMMDDVNDWNQGESRCRGKGKKGVDLKEN